MYNKDKFIKDLSVDSDIIELDLYEYYDGLNVFIKRSNNEEESYKIYDNENEDNGECLFLIGCYWYNNTKNITNLKKLTIGSRFASELKIKDMEIPKKLEYIRVPNENSLNKNVIIELLKNGCTVVIDYNDLFTDYTKPLTYPDFTEFKNIDEFTDYLNVLKIKEDLHKENTKQYYIEQEQRQKDRERIEKEKEYYEPPIGYNFRVMAINLNVLGHTQNEFLQSV